MFFPGRQCVPDVSMKAEMSVLLSEFRGESVLNHSCAGQVDETKSLPLGAYIYISMYIHTFI